MSQRKDNIENIDGSSRYRGNKVHSPSNSIFSRIRAEHFGAVIFLFVLVYLSVNLYLYNTKGNGTSYEVQAENISKDAVYTGIAVRDETLVNSEASGYVNYYIRNGKRAAKNSIVYSLDMGNSVHERLTRSFEDLKLDSEEIRQIKSVINDFRSEYSGNDMTVTDRFESELASNISDFVNENMLYGMESTIDEIENGNSYVSLVRTPVSGVISYRSDLLCGITVDQISGVYYAKDYDASPKSLKQSEIIVAGEPIYRLCCSDSWQIVVSVDEDFYLDHLEEDSISFYINGSSYKLNAEMELLQKGEKGEEYYAVLSLNDRMSSYIDDRFLDIEFDNSSKVGLKIPVSAIADRAFYLIPKSCFVYEAGTGNVLKRIKGYDESGSPVFEEIYVSKYYSDDYYAYIDTVYLNEGDRLAENDTDEPYIVRLENTLEGVYCINKGYYQFFAVDRLKSNSEYVIIRSDTKDGIRQYDRIALFADQCREGELIDR